MRYTGFSLTITGWRVVRPRKLYSSRTYDGLEMKSRERTDKISHMDPGDVLTDFRKICLHYCSVAKLAAARVKSSKEERGEKTG